MKEVEWGSKKNQQIIKKYNSTADFYDKRYRKIQTKKFVSSINELKKNFSFLLDAGCGTGLLIEFMYNNLSDIISQDFKFIGVDISINMLKEFIKKIKTTFKVFNKKISLVLADMEFLPFRKEIFSPVLSYTSLQNLQSLETGLRELIRVSKSNSEMIFSILKKKVKINSFLMQYNSLLGDMQIINKENLEDFIFIVNYSD